MIRAVTETYKNAIISCFRRLPINSDKIVMIKIRFPRKFYSAHTVIWMIIYHVYFHFKKSKITKMFLICFKVEVKRFVLFYSTYCLKTLSFFFLSDIHPVQDSSYINLTTILSTIIATVDPKRNRQ